MCRGSPGGASGAGTTRQKALECVNARRVPVAPLDLDAVSTHESYAQGADVGGYGCRIEERFTAHLLYAGRTGTCEPEPSGRIEGLMPVLVPFDLQSVVLAVDGVGNFHEGA
jgi:hypothetical protein